MNIPHYMARGGYDLVEIREMEKKMKEHQEAAKSGGDVVIDPPSPPTRHQRWKLGHTKRRGGMSSDAAREIIERIDDLEEQYRHGTFIPEGRHDILASAIKRPEHPGRVRGMGFGVGIQDYFGGSDGSTSSVSADVLEQLRKQITLDVTQSLRKEFGQTLGTSSQRPVDIQTPDEVTRVSTKGSCADAIFGSFGERSPTRDTGRAGFYVDEHPPRLVAIGRVILGDSMLHCVSLPAHLVKVVVEEAVDASAEVPVATDEVRVVGDAIGGFIAWPRDFVTSDFSKDIQRPRKQARQNDESRTKDDIMRDLLSVSSSLYKNPLPVPWDASSFGCGDADVPLYISHTDILEIVQGEEWLSLSVVQLWTM
ncbi:hypothetical protein OROHE_000113 [Orobanche hederae]